MNPTFTFTALALASVSAVFALPTAYRRLQLSLAKHPSLAGHSRMAKRVAALLPGYAYPPSRFFASDDAPAEVVATRTEGFERLSAMYQQRFARGAAMSAACPACAIFKRATSPISLSASSFRRAST